MKIIALVTHIVTSGGAFNQSLNAILQLKKISNNKFDVEIFTSKSENIKYLESLGVESTFFRLTILDKILTKIGVSSVWHTIQAKIKFVSPLEKKLLRHNCDIVYFVSPSGRPVLLQVLNYILTVWDLAHRDSPEFPEVRNYGIFHKRENFYRQNLVAAYMIIVDSEELSKKLISRYGVDHDKILVMPFSPSPFIVDEKASSTSEDVSVKYNLNRPYFYYPAQFWAHKNHIRILEALLVLKSKAIECNVVFSGADHGNLTYIENFIENNDLDKNVKILGFVPGEDLRGLYQNCISIIMPTYFGPTNIPPLEAWLLKKPIIYSAHLKAQVQDAAILIDPDDKVDLSNAMQKILTSDVNSELILKGSLMLNKVEQQRKKSETVFGLILKKFESHLKCSKEMG